MATEIRRLLLDKGIKTSQSNINLCIQIIAKNFNVKSDYVIDVIISEPTINKSPNKKFDKAPLQFIDLPEDILTTIMMDTDKHNISSMCLSTKETLRVCTNEYFWAQKFKKDFGYMKIGELKDTDGTWKGLYKKMLKSLTKTENMIDQIQKREDNNPPDQWSLLMKQMKQMKQIKQMKQMKSNAYFVLNGLYDYNWSNLVDDRFIHKILPKNIATKLREELNYEDRSEGASDLYSIMFKYKGKFKKYEGAPFSVLLNVSDFFGIGASQHISRKEMEILLEKINFYYPNTSLNYFNPHDG